MVPPYGLYYPFFHTRDPNWLKVAALYWPKLFRIVPAGYKTHDDYVANTLIDELGFIESIGPGRALADAGELFIRVVEQHGAELRRRFRVSSRRTRHGSLPADQAGAIHVGQVAPVLRTALIEADLVLWAEVHTRERVVPYVVGGVLPGRVYYPYGTRVRGDLGDWLFMHHRLASAYMGVLVERVAAASHLAPTTDQPDAFVAANNWTAESLAVFLDVHPDGTSVTRPTANPAEVIALLALDYVIPANVERISPDKIVRIRRRYGSEFQAFHAKVAEVVAGLDDLPAVENPAILRHYLNDLVAERLQRPIETLRLALRDANLNAATTAVNIKTDLPAGALLAGGALAAGHPIMAGVAGAAMGLLTVGRGARQQREQLRRDAAAASYLLNIRRKLRTPPLLDHSLYAIRRIATDS